MIQPLPLPGSLPLFGPGLMAKAALGAEDPADLLVRVETAWSLGFERSLRLDLQGGFFSVGLSAQVHLREHWLAQLLAAGEVYVGEGSAEVGSTWFTEQLGIAPRARVYAVPLQDARGQVVGALIGNCPLRPLDARELELVRGGIRAGQRLVQARDALERLAMVA